jgi:hypothetical protein
MEFTKALRKVYVANAAFWRSRHVDIDELRDLSNHLHIQTTTFRGILKENCKHAQQTVTIRLMRTKKAVAKVFHLQGVNSEADSMVMTQKLLDTHEGMYQPPDVAEVVTYATAAIHGPVARPCDGFDVDDFFESLGLCENSDKDLQPDVWGQIIALEEKFTTDRADLSALLEPCLGISSQKVSVADNANTVTPKANVTDPELWLDFGSW